MSLYGRSNTKSGTAIGTLRTLPVWLLALAGYSAIMTVINNVSEIILIIEDGALEVESMGYLLGHITALFSVILLLLFVFRRYTLCLYYLVAAAILGLALDIALFAGKTENLSFYFYTLGGLDSVPKSIIGWTVGWGSFSEPVKWFMLIAENIASLTFCALLLHFQQNVFREVSKNGTRQ